MTDLKTELRTIENLFQQLVNQHLGSKMTKEQKHQFVQLANQTSALVASENQQFWHEYWRLDETWTQLDMLLKGKTAVNRPKRPKRAILPIIGDLLSSLFGTSTKKDLNNLRKNFLQLKSSQVQLVNVLQSSLSLFNKTHITAMQNRRTLNKLINATQELSEFVSQVKFKLLVIEPLVLFTQLQAKLHLVYHIVLSTLRQNQWDIQILSTAVRDVNKGRLPMTLIPPLKLMVALRKISKRLPQGFTLPHDYAKNIQWYYRNLKTLLLPQGNTFHIVTAVPLARNDAIFTIFEALTIPIPHPTLDLVVRYELESTHLAVNHDKTSYVMLNDAELSRCVQSDTDYCSFRQPVRSIAHNPSCLAALFTKDKSTVQIACKRKLTTHDSFPMVYYLQKGKWLIASRSKFTVHISCYEGGTKTLYNYQIYKNIHILELKSGCTGISPHFTLLPYYYNHAVETIEPVISNPSVVSSLMADIWNFTDIPKGQASSKIDISNLLMENVTPLPLGDVQRAIDLAKANLQIPLPPISSKNNTLIIAAVTYVIVHVLIIFVLALYWQCTGKFPCSKYKHIPRAHGSIDNEFSLGEMMPYSRQCLLRPETQPDHHAVIKPEPPAKTPVEAPTAVDQRTDSDNLLSSTAA